MLNRKQKRETLSAMHRSSPGGASVASNCSRRHRTPVRHATVTAASPTIDDRSNRRTQSARADEQTSENVE